MTRPTAAVALVIALGAVAACTGTPSGAGGASPAPSKSPAATRSASPGATGTGSPSPAASATAAATAVATPSAPASYAPGVRVFIDGAEHFAEKPDVTRFEVGAGGDGITIDGGFLQGQWTNMTVTLQKEPGVLAAGFAQAELTGWPMTMRGSINTLRYETQIVGLRLDATSPRLQGVAESYGTPTRVGQGSGGPKIRMEFDVAFPTPAP